MPIFIILILLSALIIFFVAAFLLLLVKKLFKVQNPTYKKSIIILLMFVIMGFIIRVIFSIINLGILSNILITIGGFFIFYYLFKKYYFINWKKTLKIYIVYGIFGIILALFFIIPIRYYVVQPFSVNGDAMNPIYKNNDYLLVNMFNHEFNRGDVIVFETSNRGEYFIKRIIGVPGEKIEIKEGKVFINDSVFNDIYYSGITDRNVLINLNQNQYFVLGDNRERSRDSRDFGAIDKKSIMGKILYKVPGIIK